MDFAWHINFRLEGSRVVAPDAATQRRVARAVLDAAQGSRLLAFCAADTHVHLVAIGGRDEVGQLVRRVKIALAALLRSRLTPPFYKPVVDQRHLETAFHYVLGQARRHGYAHDPWAETSNLPDLLGLRELGSWTRTPVRAHLPRVDRLSLLAHYGLRALDPLEVVPASLVAEATAAAAGLATLAGRSDRHRAARRAALACAAAGPSALAPLLHTSRAALYRLRADEPDAALVRAIGLQAALRSRPPAPTLVAEEPGAYDAGS